MEYRYNARSGTAATTKAPSAKTYPQAKAGKTKRSMAHPCPHCDRMFAGPHNVRQHIREAHTYEKPYACQHCDSAFARPWSLYRHLESTHGIRAGPGRGRRRGLRDIGMKKPDESPTSPSEALQHTNGSSSNQLRAIQHPRIVSDTPDFEANNFTPNPTTCICGAQFLNREAYLAHRHTDHEEPPSEHCNCMTCLASVRQNAVATGGGVLAKGASDFSRLMADSAFEADYRNGSGSALFGLGARNWAAKEAFAANMDGTSTYDHAAEEAFAANMDAISSRDYAAEEAFAATIDNMDDIDSVGAEVAPEDRQSEAEQSFTLNMYSDNDHAPGARRLSSMRPAQNSSVFLSWKHDPWLELMGQIPGDQLEGADKVSRNERRMGEAEELMARLDAD